MGGGLAGAIRAQEAEQLAPGDAERTAVRGPARSALVRLLRGRGPRLRAIGRATMSPAKILSAGIGRNSNQRGQWVAARVTD